MCSKEGMILLNNCPGYGIIGLISPRQPFLPPAPSIEIYLGQGQCDAVFLFSVVFLSTLGLS